MRSAKLRQEVLERDSHKCVQCGSPGPRLAMHHREFEYGRHRPSYLDTVDDLETLCMSCHSRYHHAQLRANPRLLACWTCGHERYSPGSSGHYTCPKCKGTMGLKHDPAMEG